jgi:TPP-dependent pyruvate/acetoin dehydrogenase alpha subunit
LDDLWEFITHGKRQVSGFVLSMVLNRLVGRGSSAINTTGKIAFFTPYIGQEAVSTGFDICPPPKIVITAYLS